MSEDVLITAVVFAAIVAIIKIIAETVTRNRLIHQGLADEKARQLFARDAQLQRLSSLKWGLVLVGVGLALLVGQLGEDYITDQSTFGLMFVFAGIAFFIYYGIAQRHLNNKGEPR